MTTERDRCMGDSGLLTMIDHAHHVAMILLTREGVIESLNQTAAQSIGKPREQLLGTNVFEHFPDEIAAKRRAWVNEVVATGFTVRQEDEQAGRFFESTLSAVRNPEGIVTHVAVIALDVTDRVTAEKERDQFFNHSIDLLGIADFQGFFRQLSPSWSQVLGWTTNELTARPYLDFVHPDDREATLDAAAGLTEGHNVVGFLNRYLRRDGSWRWLSWNTYAHFESNHVFFVARDVTEERVAEQALREKEERTRTIIDNMATAVAVYSSEPGRDGASFILRQVNPAFERIEGLDRADVLGRRIEDIFPAVAGFGLLAVLTRVQASGRPERYPVRFYEDSRISGWREYYVARLPSGDIVAIYEDRTEQVQTMEQLKEANERFRLVLDGANAVVYVADFDTGEILFLNAQGRKIFGDVVGSVCWKSFRSAQEGPCPGCENPLLSDDLGRSTGPIRTEKKNPCDGRWYAIEARAIRWVDGRAVRLTTMLDITERKEATQRAVQVEQLAGLGRLAAGIAHEVNQPLSGISMGLDNILYRLDQQRLEPEYLKNKLSSLFGYVERIRSIVDHLRIYIREQHSESRAPFDLNQAVRNALDLIRIQAVNDIELHAELAPELPLTMGNIYRIERVVINLLENAFHAIESRAETADRPGRIEIRTAPSDGGALLIVRDNGVGIPPDHLTRIFDPFFTTKSPESGTGLGLAIVRDIIRECDGAIEVESSPGEGSTFRIRVPGHRESA